MKKYELLAKTLSDDIRQGKFQPEHKLPSLRSLCDQYEVSLSTVVKAFDRLRELDLIESRERSGFYLKPTKTQALPRPSAEYILEAPTQINHRRLSVELLRSTQEKALCSMSAAVPDDVFLPTTQLDKCFRQALKKRTLRKNGYEASIGNDLLRHQISLYMHNIGCSVNADDVVVTAGCTEAMSIALQAVTKPGDTVAVELPTYHAFWLACDLLNLHIIEVPTDPGDGISVGALEMAIERWDVKACLLSTNFSNPTGACLSDTKKKRLASLCTEHDIYIIEDDVYGDLSHDIYYRPTPLKAFDQNDRVIYCNSFSKTISPGLRVGWVINQALTHDFEYRKYVQSVSTAAVSQLAATEYLKSQYHDRFLRSLRQKYAIQISMIIRKIQQLFPRDVHIFEPAGGFILWLKLPSHVDSVELLEHALLADVSFNPGVLFSASGKYRHYIRLNCARNWDICMDQALERLAGLCQLAIDKKLPRRLS